MTTLFIRWRDVREDVLKKHIEQILVHCGVCLIDSKIRFLTEEGTSNKSVVLELFRRDAGAIRGARHLEFAVKAHLKALHGIVVTSIMFVDRSDAVFEAQPPIVKFSELRTYLEKQRRLEIQEKNSTRSASAGIAPTAHLQTDKSQGFEDTEATKPAELQAPDKISTDLSHSGFHNGFEVQEMGDIDLKEFPSNAA